MPRIVRPARPRSHVSSPRRCLMWCAALGLLVVVAAGVEGTGRLTGPRWTPHAHIGPLKVATRPPPPAPSFGRAPTTHSSGHVPIGAILLWVAIGLGVVVIALLVWWWRGRAPHRRVRRDEVTTEPAPAASVAVGAEAEPDVPTVRGGLEEALDYLSHDGEPDDAVVRAWLGLQRSAEQSGVPRRAAETPTEFTARILGRVVADDRAVTTLLRLYLRARFGDLPVTADDVTLARATLRELVSEWDPSGSAHLGAGG